MPSRKIEDCHPVLQPILREFVKRSQAAGVTPLITCTYRSNAEQAQEYAKGRTLPGPKTTNAKPGQSRHNDTLNGKPASTAFDVVPMVGGACMWDAKHPHWQTMGKIGEELGLEWAGRWVSFKEYPHFQLKVRP